MRFPAAFRDRYSAIAPGGFFDALDAGLPKTIRVNTLKSPISDFGKRAKGHGWDLQPLPWQPDGFVIDREDRTTPLGHSLEHFSGHMYIQEGASQIPPLVLDPQPGERVLDMAAAPGSKTTQIAARMENRGLLVANDLSVPRIKALSANLERVGTLNTIVTQLTGNRLGRFLPGYFDRILLDAPCTAEGTLAKSPDALIRWSEKSIQKLATLQSKLLAGAYGALKPGGTLVYSTCTFAPEENEGVVSELLKNHPDAEVESFELPGLDLAPGLSAWRGEVYHPGVTNARRVWPGRERLEGFFIAKLRKGAGEEAPEPRRFNDRRYGETDVLAGEWLADRFGLPAGWADSLVIREKQTDRWLMTPEASEFNRLPTVRRGLRIARTVTKGYKPTTDWCQIFGGQATTNIVQTNAAETTDYLAGQDIPYAGPDRGYVMLVSDGIAFACGLAQEGRIKNQIPVSRRIGT